jgi:5'(3')-deoxyribonucleotidase
VSIIAVDLDGTMYEYHSAFVYMARNYLGVDMPDASEWERWDWPYQFMHQGERRWMEEAAPRKGLYRYGHIMKGAIIGIRKLAERHDVVIITHRPRVAVQDTLAWLTYANLPLSGLHILSEGQSKSSVQYDLLIDDRPENIEDAIGHGRQGVVFDQPWNQDYPALYRATWEEMEDVVAKALG